MLYVSGKSFGGMYLLADSETGEEVETTEEAILDKAKSGVPIYRVYNEDNNYIIRLPGIGENASLEYYAMTHNKQYLIDEYDIEKNDLSVTSINYNYSGKVHWICPKGHKYMSRLRDRAVVGKGCHYCANQKVLRGYNDFETWCKDNNRLDLLDEWDYESNTKKPYEVVPHSSTYEAHWICPRGHRYICRLDHRTNDNVGCKYCTNQTSFPEQAILFYMKSEYLNVESRYKYDNKYEIDIYLPDYNIGIEYDGANWHSSEDSIRRDEEKNRVLSEAGIKLIRLREGCCPKIEKYDSVEIKVSKFDLDLCIRDLKHALNSYGVVFDADINTERDRQSILGEYLSVKKDSSIKVTHPNIAYEWCHERNGKLKPDMFTAGSDEKVWWRCVVCNTEYQALIVDRCRSKNGCPFCARINSRRSNHEIFYDYHEIEPFWSDKNPSMRETSFYTKQPMIICCPKCGFEEIVGRLSNRVKRQEGLTCKKCGYHVKVDKWEKERHDFLDKQKRDKDMMASFNEFLKKQGLSSIGE